MSTTFGNHFSRASGWRNHAARVATARAGLHRSEESAKELETHVKGVDASPEACLAALRRVASQLHRFRVSTLDSFFAQIARTFSLEMMLPPGCLRSIQRKSLFLQQMQAVQEMLDTHDRQTLVKLGSYVGQRRIATPGFESDSSTVRAGYGAFRVTNADAWDQLPLPAAVRRRWWTQAIRCWIRGIRTEGFEGNLKSFRRRAKQGDWETICKHGIYKQFDSNEPKYYGKVIEEPHYSALETLRKQAAAVLFPIRRAQTIASYDVLKAYDERYSTLTRRQRTLAFSDVSYLLSKWMLPRLSNSKDRKSKDHRRAPAARLGRSAANAAAHGLRVHHLLLDEFQDTSPEQWRFCNTAAEPLAEKADREHSFFLRR